MVRRLYTPDLANRSLPLVRRIAADIQATARRIQSVAQASPGKGQPTVQLEDELHELRHRFAELVGELASLGVELKDPLTGLLDFRATRQGTVVYLCWRLGEDAVDHWHTLESGFAGRQPIGDF